MKNLLEIQNENGKTSVIYHYKSLREIDDVILQLLNEADLEGFAKSSLNKASETVIYDVSGYISLNDIKHLGSSMGALHAMFDNLYRLLAYLEDSFIDIDYVVYDSNCIFLHPDTKQLYLIVLPCQDAMEAEITLADCLEKMLAAFSCDGAANQALMNRVLARIRRGVHSLADFQELLRVFEGGRQDVEEQPQEETIINLNLDDFFAKEDKNNQNDIPIDKDLVSDMVREEIREELRGEVRSEVIEEVRGALRAEVTEEVRKELRAEVIEEVRKELRAEVVEEVREELRKDVLEEVSTKIRAEIRAEAAAEAAEELVPDMNERKIPYLIRKKTGEVIQLNRDTFIIGKMNTCCDYVIKNNNSISRLHAVIKYREASDDYFIADCNSTNHTYLNGRRIQEDHPVTLEDRMHIHLATEEFIFRV